MVTLSQILLRWRFSDELFTHGDLRSDVEGFDLHPISKKQEDARYWQDIQLREQQLASWRFTLVEKEMIGNTEKMTWKMGGDVYSFPDSSVLGQAGGRRK
jgi:hypothetical protein